MFLFFEHISLFDFSCTSSHKFGKKVAYFSSLSALREHLQCGPLAVPPEVVQ